MKTIILSAGTGSRLKYGKPKSLIDLDGRKLIEVQLNLENYFEDVDGDEISYDLVSSDDTIFESSINESIYSSKLVVLFTIFITKDRFN